MKGAALALLIADDEDGIAKSLVAAFSARDKVAAHTDRHLPLTRIGKTLIIHLPAFGTGAPAPETTKPVNAKQIPWCPERLVWVARDEMRKRQMEASDRRAFTQTVKVELMTMLAQSSSVIAIRTRPGFHCGDDLLVFDLPDLLVREVRLYSNMSGPAILSALSSTFPYQRSRTKAETARFRDELDYIVSTNLAVGITGKLKAAKAGPLRGVRCSLAQLGILATYADSRMPGGNVRWEAEIVVKRNDNDYLAAFLSPAPPPGSRYDALFHERPRVNANATVSRMERRELVAPIPQNTTLGNLVDVALSCGDDALPRLPEALRFLVRQHILTYDLAAPDSVETAEATARALAEGGYDTPNVTALLDRIHLRRHIEIPTSDGLSPTASLSKVALMRLDVTPLYQAIITTVADRWAQRLLGPLRCEQVDVYFACAGKSYRTVRYDKVVDLGWQTGDGVPLLPERMEVGDRWTVEDSQVEAEMDQPHNSPGHRFDLLTREKLVDDPWATLRYPGATLNTPSATLDALRRLIDNGFLEIRSGHLSLSAIGRQIISCVPPVARLPVWAVNLRSVARRAENPALRQMLKQDLFAVLHEFKASLEAAPVIVSKAAWTKTATAAGAGAGRSDDRGGRDGNDEEKNAQVAAQKKAGGTVQEQTSSGQQQNGVKSSSTQNQSSIHKVEQTQPMRPTVGGRAL